MNAPDPGTTHRTGGSLPGRCPFCDSSRRPGLQLPPDRLDPDASAVEIAECSGCGTVESLVAPGEDSGGAGSGEAYLPHARPGGMRGWLARRGQERKVEVVLPWVMAPGVVDIGCGSGGFLEAWRRRRPGDQLVGMEPDPGAAAQARGRDLVVIAQGLEEPLPPGAHGMGIYTLWHVLEHLPDPAGALSLIRRGMTVDGRIVLAVPNRSAAERAIYGRWTIAWDPPRHRWHFTPEGLSALVRASGLRVLDRFNLVSDDIYDAVGSIRWFLDHRAWTEPRRLRALAATAAAVATGLPIGLATATMAPWRSRASLGLVLARA
jgi:SAM-dependent methyltransferase